MILLFDQKFRQGDTHIERGSAVRITVLQTFLLSLLVCQTFVGLGDHDKFGAGFWIIRISVRVVE